MIVTFVVADDINCAWDKENTMQLQVTLQGFQKLLLQLHTA